MFSCEIWKNFKTPILKKTYKLLLCVTIRDVNLFFSSRVSLSQPDPIINHGHVNDNEIIRDENCAAVWYSQPSNIEDMFLSQMSSTPGSSQVSLLNLIIERNLVNRFLHKKSDRGDPFTCFSTNSYIPTF